MNIYFLFLLILIKKEKTISDKIKSIQINNTYSLEKIRLTRSILPYLPQEYLPIINQSLQLTEYIIKLNEAVDFMKTAHLSKVQEVKNIEDNKDRINYILNTLQTEIKKSNIKHDSKLFDTIDSINHYKKIINILSNFDEAKGNLDDPANLIKLIGPLISSEEESDKFNDILKMFDLIKALP